MRKRMQLELLEQLRVSAEQSGCAIIITKHGWDYLDWGDAQEDNPDPDMEKLIFRSSMDEKEDSD